TDGILVETLFGYFLMSFSGRDRICHLLSEDMLFHRYDGLLTVTDYRLGGKTKKTKWPLRQRNQNRPGI
ncbi:MAG: hypothetical protein ACXWW4_07405, partial [Candidatus Binatia bacterium]